MINNKRELTSIKHVIRRVLRYRHILALTASLLQCFFWPTVSYNVLNLYSNLY